MFNLDKHSLERERERWDMGYGICLES
uniref:Uncharacterized protein n=1 Tax=Rhizophora mucronata TaxID=61149 RepID=A0A2P2QFE9_RHIMU